MAEFSQISSDRLNTCHPDLIRLFHQVVKTFDCAILEGHRGKKKQQEYFAAKISEKDWPHGKHNKKPSEGVDVVPYPIVWTDTRRFYFFAGYVKAVADMLGIRIRWGGDWDQDTRMDDQDFNDLVHFELTG